ncbi:TPA: glycoside hydrolase family protein [Klebsiella pneumoniae subsp. pneumoniae]|nr:glycoside hydrolase family protein [Klebsiella pneumoniae subsp. pneumoniae]
MSHLFPVIYLKSNHEAERCVNTYGNGRRLSDNTFSAVTSITFNAGCANMQKSTLFSLLLKGQVTQACNQFPRWVYGGGKVIPGLVTRRAAEKQLCLDGVK